MYALTEDIKKEEVKEIVHPAVLAVTACPTGIAHTFMAAKALEQAGEKLNISIKVETNGQEGVKNQLTQDDIDHCTCIIVAADKKVEMQRFEAKKVIQVPVEMGFQKLKSLFKKQIMAMVKYIIMILKKKNKISYVYFTNI